jgi:prepilin-type N-terminal cleavage/methylation domain-containing protein
MNNLKRRLRTEDGFSLIEITVVVGIMAVLGGMAVVQIGLSKSSARGDAAMRVVLYQMNQARELAIGQRRYMQVTFDTARNQMNVMREDSANGGNPLTTTINSVGFEGGAMFGLVAGLPDTPDAFGMAASTSFTSSNGTFSSTVVLGNTKVAKFAPDGTLVDWNGRTANGTVFISIPINGSTNSARAVTVLGSTGRVRGYRWDGRGWKVV